MDKGKEETNRTDRWTSRGKIPLLGNEEEEVKEEVGVVEVVEKEMGWMWLHE